jgi:hypothetical protein
MWKSANTKNSAYWRVNILVNKVFLCYVQKSYAPFELQGHFGYLTVYYTWVHSSCKHSVTKAMDQEFSDPAKAVILLITAY